MAAKVREAESIENASEKALEFALIAFGMGVALVDGNIVIEGDVPLRLKQRYRSGMRTYLEKHGVDFDRDLQKYLTRRGKQIGTNAARIAVELEQPNIDGDLFDDAAAGVEAEINKLTRRYEKIHTKKLGGICERKS